MADGGRLPDELPVGVPDEELVQILDERGRPVASSDNVAGQPAVARLAPGESTELTSPLEDEDDDFVVAAAGTPDGRYTVLVGHALVEVLESTQLVIRLLAIGLSALLALVALVLLGAGGTALWADRTQRDGGYVTTDVHDFSTSGAALATVSTELGSAGLGWLYAPGLLDEVRIRVTPTSRSAALFVGIGPSTEVDRYLAGVGHSVITEFWGEKTEAVDGGQPASAPGAQDFWVASASGAGPQTLEWDPADGSWTVVVMNADGQPGIDVGADLGARMPAVLWIAIGVLLGGMVFLAGGALLIANAIRRR
jgi:hypothetical protein